MTLREEMIADVVDVFLDDEEHAETVRYVSQNSAARDIKAIIERMEDLMPAAGWDGARVTLLATMMIATAAVGGIVDPREGDKVIIDGDEWHVKGRPQQDGLGFQKLSLVRTATKEKSHQDWRDPVGA